MLWLHQKNQQQSVHNKLYRNVSVSLINQITEILSMLLVFLLALEFDLNNNLELHKHPP
jgi:hypothetical protein